MAFKIGGETSAEGAADAPETDAMLKELFIVAIFWTQFMGFLFLFILGLYHRRLAMFFLSGIGAFAAASLAHDGWVGDLSAMPAAAIAIMATYAGLHLLVMQHVSALNAMLERASGNAELPWLLKPLGQAMRDLRYPEAAT